MKDTMYQLSDDAHYCVMDDRIIFLDIDRDNYQCLDKKHSAIASAVLSNGGIVDMGDFTGSNGKTNQEQLEVVNAFIEEGILVKSRSAVRRRQPIELLAADVSLTDNASATGDTTSVKNGMQFDSVLEESPIFDCNCWCSATRSDHS